jgi:ketosteroid isomerase-like protein
MADDAKAAVSGFLRAFERGDLRSLAELLTEDFVGHITSADAGIRKVDRDGYVAAVRSMDVRSANLRLEVPNIVEVEPGRVLVMVEVQAQRGPSVLHNFSGQLATVTDGKLSELWMVEASLPRATHSGRNGAAGNARSMPGLSGSRNHLDVSPMTARESSRSK